MKYVLKNEHNMNQLRKEEKGEYIDRDSDKVAERKV